MTKVMDTSPREIILSRTFLPPFSKGDHSSRREFTFLVNPFSTVGKFGVKWPNQQY